MKYRVDPARFAIDTIESETIVMDLVDGRLFLLESGAAVVWDLVSGGVPLDLLEAAVEQACGVAVRDDVRAFVADLCVLGILEEATEDVPAPTSVTIQAELGPLIITAYDDMTSIITMDPIHDVDPSRGWPFDATV
jgi:hypothetical protein